MCDSDPPLSVLAVACNLSESVGGFKTNIPGHDGRFRQREVPSIKDPRLIL